MLDLHPSGPADGCELLRISDPDSVAPCEVIMSSHEYFIECYANAVTDLDGNSLACEDVSAKLDLLSR